MIIHFRVEFLQVSEVDKQCGQCKHPHHYCEVPHGPEVGKVAKTQRLKWVPKPSPAERCCPSQFIRWFTQWDCSFHKLEYLFVTEIRRFLQANELLNSFLVYGVLFWHGYESMVRKVEPATSATPKYMQALEQWGENELDWRQRHLFCVGIKFAIPCRCIILSH